MTKPNSELVINEKLKSIYYRRQDAVLLDSGVIETTDFHSDTIDEIRTAVKESAQLRDEFLGERLTVQEATPNRLSTYMRTLSQDNQQIQPAGNESDMAKNAKVLFQEAVELGVSDIHILLFKHHTDIEVRVDGVMVSLPRIEQYDYGANLISWIFNECETKDEDFNPIKPNRGPVEETPKMTNSANLRFM